MTRRRMRNIRILFALVSLTLMVVFGVLMVQQNIIESDASEITDKSKLGKLNHYNGLLFGDYTAHQADIEGAIAVGGQLTYLGVEKDGFDFGASYSFKNTVQLNQYTNESGYPTAFLASDNIKFGADNAYYNVYGGSAVFSESLYQKYLNGSARLHAQSGYLGEFTVSDKMAADWFEYQYDFVKAAQETYIQGSKRTIDFNSFSTSGVWLNGGSTVNYTTEGINAFASEYQRIAIVTVDTGSTIDFNQYPNYIYIDTDWVNNDDYDLIIYNFPSAVNVSFQGAMSIRGSVKFNSSVGVHSMSPNSLLTEEEIQTRKNACQKIVWSFPQAQNIDFMNYAIFGSIMAPEASVTTLGGSINGQLIAKNLDQAGGFELHAFRMNDPAVDIVEFEDEEDTFDLEITKYLKFNGERDITLQGAKFKLDKWNEETSTYEAYDDGMVFTTDSSGKINLEEVPEGRYRLEETEAPYLGEINKENDTDMGTYYQYEFEISDDFEGDAYYQNDGSGIIKISRYNEPMTIDVSFYKKGNGGTALEGAVFTLWREEDSYYHTYRIREDIVSDENGVVEFVDLPPGTYTVEETEAPNGYILGENITFEIVMNADGQLVVEGLESYDIINELGDAKNVISILKYDAGSADGYEAALEGAEFELWKYDESEEEWVKVELENGQKIITDSHGSFRINDLPYGKYRLVETKAPSEDYILVEYEEDSEFGPGIYVKEFEVLPDYAERQELLVKQQEIQIEAENSEESLEPEPTEPEVIEGGEGSEDEQDETIETENESETESEEESELETETEQEELLDEILLSEEEASINLLDSDEGDETQYIEIEVGNKKLKTGFLIYKTSSILDEEKKSTPLWRAIFTLYKLNQHGSENYYASGYTDENGYLIFQDLEIGKYVLKETSVPAGHKRAEDVAFEVVLGTADELEIVIEAPDERVFVRTSGEETELAEFKIEIENKAYMSNKLEIIKIDKDVYASGIGEAGEEVIYTYTYLEGAVFQLYRRTNSGEEYQKYGETFTSTLQWETSYDGDGNPQQIQVAKAVFENLPYGQYQVVEVFYPGGYESQRAGNVAATFTITESMAQQENPDPIRFTVTNLKISARSELKVQKIDKDTGNALADTQFKLWRIKSGGEEWNSDVTIEDALQNWAMLEFGKYAMEITTDSSGWASLGELEPGLYALFESEPPGGEDGEYLYVNDLHNTRPNDMDISFYYHLTVFKVVPMNEEKISDGVRIQWVHQAKIETDEARFDNAAHEKSNEEWDQSDFSENDYRTFQITNRKVKVPGIEFQKVDADTGDPLEDAVFTLYKGKKDSQGDVSFDDIIGTFTSEGDGKVSIQIEEEHLSKAVYPELSLGYFMLEETSPPTGYNGDMVPIYFELAVNSLTKAVDMYEINADGSRIYIDVDNGIRKTIASGYVQPQDGQEKGTYLDIYQLSDVANSKKKGQFKIKKVLAEKSTEDETFIFLVERLKNGEAEEIFYGSLTVGAGAIANEIIFADMPYGIYRITELGTNWRYELNQDSEQKILILSDESIEQETNIVEFENIRDNDYWISDKNNVINKMRSLDEN